MPLEGRSIVEDALVFLKNPRGETAFLKIMKCVNQRRDEETAKEIYFKNGKHLTDEMRDQIITAALPMWMGSLATHMIEEMPAALLQAHGERYLKAALNEECLLSASKLLSKNIDPSALLRSGQLSAVGVIALKNASRQLGNSHENAHTDIGFPPAHRDDKVPVIVETQGDIAVSRPIKLKSAPRQTV